MPNTFIVLLTVLFCNSPFAIGEISPAANLDPDYQSLRNLKPAGQSFNVNQMVLKRDAAKFVLTGTICFASPVQGRITGAVFRGAGTFTMEPPLAVEKTNISRLTKQPRIEENFDEGVFRFTDDTPGEISQGSEKMVGTSGCSDSYWNDISDSLRKTLKWNLSARVLQDLYTTANGGFFAAFIKGKKYSDKEIFLIDPTGAPDVAPEEVEFLSWGETKHGIWAAFHLSPEYASGVASGGQRNALTRIDRQQLDLTIERGGKINGKATTTFIAQQNGVRVVPFTLYSTLRVESVTDTAGEKLNFIQEEKDRDAEYWVILPKSMAAGDKFSVVTVYGGKDALANEGNGNYYLVNAARDSWYPGNSLHDHASFEMRFSYPKGYRLVASGTPVQESTEGSQTISEWRSETPQTTAAFHIGKFKKDQKIIANLAVETYVNEKVPDVLQEIMKASLDGNASPTLGAITTVGMAKKAMAEAEIAMQLYTDYFGPSAFRRLAMTQQTADDYGQSWPQLVWLPLSYFLDSTIRHELYNVDDIGYFKVVGPHEIAHQWWGHTVSWSSYRDQWMSEGFAELSASIFLQMVYKGKPDFIQFWNDERDLLIKRDIEGYRAIDVGPVTLGYRLNNTKVGNISEKLIYPKGGYILHMIRMMMRNAKTGDDPFKAMMKDFVSTYHSKSATTEDFKAIVEKHMIQGMNLAGNGTMDWFFNEYVYGTYLPSYKLDYTLNGLLLEARTTQSGVDDGFMMLVPFYLELVDGRIVRLGATAIQGNTTVVSKIDLANYGVTEKPKRVMLNYMNDVLAEKVEQK